MSVKKANPFMAVGAMFIGVAAMPVAAFVNVVLGIAMMALPMWMIYKAS